MEINIGLHAGEATQPGCIIKKRRISQTERLGELKVWCVFQNNGRHVKGQLVAVTSAREWLPEFSEPIIIEEWEIDTDLWAGIAPEMQRYVNL